MKPNLLGVLRPSGVRVGCVGRPASSGEKSGNPGPHKSVLVLSSTRVAVQTKRLLSPRETSATLKLAIRYVPKNDSESLEFYFGPIVPLSHSSKRR